MKLGEGGEVEGEGEQVSKLSLGLSALGLRRAYDIGLVSHAQSGKSADTTVFIQSTE